MRLFGGGGSFKNGKPVGEVRCCESWMQSKSTDGSKGGWRQRSVVVVVVESTCCCSCNICLNICMHTFISKLVSLCVALPKCALAVAAQQSCKAMRKTYGSSTRCMPITWCKPRPLSHGIVTSTRTYESNTYQRQHNDVTGQNVVQRTPLEPYGTLWKGRIFAERAGMSMLARSANPSLI